jgi:thiosulfate/3-mercaptopyruvate sulfurtransferase
MEKKAFLALSTLILIVSFFLSGDAYAKHKHGPPWARMIDPIVTTEWLAENSDLEDLVILDIRSTNDYGAGHIPNAINEPFLVPFSAWITMRDDLLLELPEDTALFNTIGSLGIKKDSRVVIVTAPNLDEPPFYGLANATRVTDTLLYAGIKNVAILDGGYPKWVIEGREITGDIPVVAPVTYHGEVNKEMFVSTKYVRKHIWEARIIDARDADVYFGITIEPFADKAGHIPNATSLPAPWIWDLNPNGTYTYKDPETLAAMASGVIREPWDYCGKGHWGQEIIVYCGVGGYASSWWFVLTQVLGYDNVKFYDGSAQEWVRYYDMIPYQWD